jgi:hypothetical protein
VRDRAPERVEAAEPEEGDGLLQLLRLIGERFRRGRDLLGRGGILLRHLIELLDRLVDVDEGLRDLQPLDRPADEIVDRAVKRPLQFGRHSHSVPQP